MSITSPQSFNRYAYVQNDPVNFVDPSGLDGNFTFVPFTGAQMCQIFGIGCGGSGGGGPSDVGFEIEQPSPEGPSGGGGEIVPLPSNLRDRVSDVVNNPKTDCAEFIKKLLGAAAKNGKAFSDNALDIFDRVQREAGFKLKRLESSHGGEAGFEGSKRVVYIQPRSSSDDSRVLEHTKYGYAVTVVNELMHQARKGGLYDDRTLGKSIFTLLSPEQRAAHPLPRSNDVEVNSQYFHSLFKLHCRSVTGE